MKLRFVSLLNVCAHVVNSQLSRTEIFKREPFMSITAPSFTFDYNRNYTVWKSGKVEHAT